MADHPVHQASKSSPYGILTREEFCRKHQIMHKESFMINKKGMKLFTQSWKQNSTNKLKGLVAMVHGYTSDSGWLNELTAVAIAKAGFYVCALDLQGHGRSDGIPGHIPRIKPIVNDCIKFFNSARASQPHLPAFLYGESLGGAICILICLKQKEEWKGLILSGAMCGVSPKFRPIWPLEKLVLPVAAAVAPTLRSVAVKPLGSRSFKVDWKKQLASRNPNRRAAGKPPLATAQEFLKVCAYIKKNCHELEVPILIVHGEDDAICDSDSAKMVHDMVASEDKTLKIFKGMWHVLIGEPKENVEQVFGTILSWLQARTHELKQYHAP